MNLFRLLFTCAAVAPLLSGSAARAQALLGNSFNGVLYDIDLSTGAATNPRSTGTGVDSLTGIAVAPDGTLYGLTTFVATPPNQLVVIDPATGTSSAIGSTGLNTVAEGDLAFDPTSGVLYGIQEVPGSRQLFTLDVSTGAGTVIGNLGGLSDGDYSAMAFTPAGSLYILDTGVDRGSHLLTVNKATASIVDSVTLSVDLGFTAGMTFHPATGVLYVADGGVGEGTDSLYALNPTTGVLTLLGPTGLPDGLAGLAFKVPEPNSAALAILLMPLGLAMRRRTG